jgi:hypothetical protein
MDSATAQPEGPAPGETPPAALLELPADWFNILEDQDDIVAARRRYESVLQRIFPTMEPQAREQGVEALLAWRETIWNAGFLTHGIMTAPPTDDSGPLLWQILITLVKLPDLHQEINPGAMLARLMNQKAEDALHVEHFETRLGFGAGLVSLTPLAPRLRQPQNPYTMSGSAAAISCPRGGGWSILVMGISYDPDQAAQLGWLVGQIAGHSTLEEQEEPPELPEQPPEKNAESPQTAAPPLPPQPTKTS